MTSRRSTWKALHLERVANGVYERRWEIDPFRAWTQARRPEARAEASFVCGLEVCYADPAVPWGRLFLQRALDIAELSLADGWLSSGLRVGSFPGNRGRSTRIKVYARALLGYSYDIGALLGASRDLVAYCEKLPHELWAETDEDDYLGAARLALIAGEDGAGLDLLDRHAFRWLTGEADLLRRLVHADVSAETTASYRISRAPPSALWDGDHEAWFQWARAPGDAMVDRRDGELLPFEIGALRRRCRASLADADDWAGVIADIAL